MSFLWWFIVAVSVATFAWMFQVKSVFAQNGFSFRLEGSLVSFLSTIPLLFSLVTLYRPGNLTHNQAVILFAVLALLQLISTGTLIGLRVFGLHRLKQIQVDWLGTS